MTAWRQASRMITAALVLFVGAGARLGATSDEKSAAAVDEVFSDLTKPGSPGCALAVYREGKIIYAKGYGLANIEDKVAITPQTVFDIGSTSKQFTAASVLLLEEQGKLSLNDDIRKYVPELPAYGQKITILQLLNHTSGLRDYLTLMELAGINIDNVTTDADALALITRQKALNFTPGSDWLYSNTGFFLLSVVVQRASAQSLREFAAKNIFAPLAMTHTQYRDSHTALIAGRALAYDEKENKLGYALNVSYFEQTGDGAVHTSVEDLLKWDENFYSPRVGGKVLLSEIQEPGKLNGGKLLDYAKGLFVQNYRGLHTVNHGGAWGGYRAELLRFPDQHFSVACLCNVGNAGPSRRAHQVADVYLGNLMEPKENKSKEAENKEKKEIALSAEELREFSGEYWSEELAVVYRLGVVEGKIRILSISGASGSPRTNTFATDVLRPTGTGELAAGKSGITLHFHGDPQQPGFSFTLDAGRTKGIVFQRKRSTGS
ncbi:MAG TPA: serine hydrolase domain-containing protein [Candidatus Acidoferrum sp.]|nr:serine hydrolase domain-containing protein [Candidatus Acidoferrum sp.]